MDVISVVLIIAWLALMVACPVLAIELCRVVRHNRELSERNAAQAVTICSLQRYRIRPGVHSIMETIDVPQGVTIIGEGYTLDPVGDAQDEIERRMRGTCADRPTHGGYPE